MREDIVKLHEEGKSYTQIAEELGCSKGTIAYHLNSSSKEKTLQRQRKSRGLPYDEELLSSSPKAPRKFCIDCGEVPVWRQGSRCADCKKNHLSDVRDSVTLGDCKGSSRELHFALIKVRNHARKYVKPYMGEPKCAVCGYSTYVEICHKKPIRDFDDSATLKEINHLDNLVFLCPNHHKELDLGLLNLVREIRVPLL